MNETKELFAKLFVSVDLARLLKEAKFDQPCLAGYTVDSELLKYPSAGNKNMTEYPRVYEKASAYNKHIVKAPTYDQVLNWLDDQGIRLQPMLIAQLQPEKGWGYELSVITKSTKISSDEDQSYSSRKEALEAGIKHALQYIVME